MERVKGIEPLSRPWKGRIINHYTIPARPKCLVILAEKAVSFNINQLVAILFVIISKMSTKQIKIAIVGHPLSGKDTVGEYLASEYGFTHLPTGQMVRDYMAANDLGEPTRDMMQKVANEVRAAKGADYFLRLALDSQADRVAVNGLRAVGEIQAARDAGCIIIAAVAPIEKRYEWAKARGRVSDRVSFEDFEKQELAEGNSKNEAEQNVDAAIQAADYTVGNESDLAHLYLAVDRLMAQLGVERVATDVR